MTVQVVKSVIRKNRPVRCTACGKVLEYTPSDVTPVYSKGKDEVYDTFITCPACQKKVHV